MAERDDDDAGLRDGDRALLDTLGRGNEWLRSLLCTLARRGRWLYLEDPTRAAVILDTLAAYPFYKAGQFLFDLMEWEDFMLDGPPPPLMTTALDARALQNLTDALNRIRAQLDGAEGAQGAAQDATDGVSVQPVTGAALPAELPPIEASQYLYQYVVLGAWLSAAPVAGQ